MAPKREDPIEKIGRMIDEKIKDAFAGRERTETEAKDPWARLEGIVDRAVDKHFKAFADALDEEEAGGSSSSSGGGKRKRGDDDEGDGKILGGLFG